MAMVWDGVQWVQAGAFPAAPQAVPPQSDGGQLLEQQMVGPGSTLAGEVRFGLPEQAQQALAALDGSLLCGQAVSVKFHGMNNPSGTKLLVTGIPAECSWQELKDHFRPCGEVAYAGFIGKGKGKGKGKGFGPVQPQPMAMGPFAGAAYPDQATAKRGLEGAPYEGVASEDPHAKRPRLSDPRDTVSAVVRYESPGEAAEAVAQFNGMDLGNGNILSVALDELSTDGTKVRIRGLPGHTQFTELKDFCGQLGRVSFCSVMKESDLQLREAETSITGEIRYANLEHVQVAKGFLHNTVLGEVQINVHEVPEDPLKLRVTNLSPFTQWQDLKDHFALIGPVTYASIGAESPAPAPAPPAPAPPAAPQQQQQQQMMVQQLPPQAMPPQGLPQPAAQGFQQQPMGQQVPQYLPQQVPQQVDRYAGYRMAGDSDPTYLPRRSRTPNQPGPNGTLTGEVRYEVPEEAQLAIEQLNGSTMKGGVIKVFLHGMKNPNGTKILVCNIPPGCTWRDLKEHFMQCGTVAYANC